MATDLTGMSLEQLMAMRQKLAQAANRQMRRLTERGYTKGNAMSQWAQPYLQRHGRTRFSERKTPFLVKNPYKETLAGVRLKTEAEIRAEQIRMEKMEIAQIEKFMHAKTYKIRDIEEQRKKARDAFKNLYDIDLPDETIDELFELSAFDWVRQMFGYRTVVEMSKAIAEGQATTEEVKKKIDAARARYKESEVENWTVEQLFRELGMNWKPEYRQQRR